VVANNDKRLNKIRSFI